MNAPAPSSSKPSPKRRWLMFSALGALLIIAMFITMNLGGETEDTHQYYRVKRAPFLVTIVESGTLDAVREVVIRNEVQGTSRIIYIVPEGSTVTNGQLLVELDTGEADDRVNEREISYQKANSTFIQAEKDLQIQESVIQSSIDTAQLKVVFADIELEKFEKGVRFQELRNAEIDITTATSKLLLAQDTLDWSRTLYDQGFETKNTVDQGENEVLNLTLQLEKSRTNLWVLTNFDHPKNRRKFESDVEEAQKEHDRTIAQGEGKMVQLQADLITQSNSLRLVKRKLEDDREQLEKSRIFAPQAGLVVYAIGRSRFSSESLIEEGAQVRNRQELIKLPDTSAMKVSIKVHESHVSKVHAGQKAFIVLDSLPDKRFKAEVSKVGLLPDAQERWGNPNLKVYKTEVQITDTLPDIKPGVSARAEIIVTNIPAAITVPIQSVTTHKGTPAVYALHGGTVEPVTVEVGLFNTKFIEIISGIGEGDLVMLSPPFDSEENDLGRAIIDDTESLSEKDIKPSARPQASEPPRNGRSGMDSTSSGGGPGNAGGGPPQWPANNQAGTGERPSGERGDRPPGGRAEFMKRFDKNGDGEIDASEREAMRAQFGGGRPGGSGRSGGGRPPGGGGEGGGRRSGPRGGSTPDNTGTPQ